MLKGLKSLLYPLGMLALPFSIASLPLVVHYLAGDERIKASNQEFYVCARADRNFVESIGTIMPYRLSDNNKDGFVDEKVVYVVAPSKPALAFRRIISNADQQVYTEAIAQYNKAKERLKM